ncbi:hypothetical protein N5P37_010986 [Trichoderma harzianum]|uniref:Uncharacterized protein n=1 Tax=Trichoderma harzianum CBS 226.95 TaxID=983964 RepID=A0A2T3ZRF9_TRIHA|nr:hypothetical protein M431DRAFT_11766 [Trichoderma harzianum CBS 226.95]KAK0756335.1 hypothetical protein N5P37_010986 [Trichoderma harzianum]PTB47393.1 hypothetical protein M431DRAFT_11766 [Trichoderma harzianum CBS 226.95]
MENFENIENVWPDLQSEPPSPLPTCPSPELPPVVDREPTPWDTVQALEDERLSANSAVIRQLIYEPMYAHLTNVYIDWDLEGYVCRVIGSRCYGRLFPGPFRMQEHLRIPYHLAHNASHAPRELTPPPRTDYVRRSIETSGAGSNLAEPDANPNAIEIEMLPDLVSGASMFAEIPDSQDPGSEFTVVVRDSVEIPDSKESGSELSAFDSPPGEISDILTHVTDVVTMGDSTSEIEHTQVSIIPVLQHPSIMKGTEANDESSDDTESVKSVIFVKPCEERNCEKCAGNFTVS